MPISSSSAVATPACGPRYERRSGTRIAESCLLEGNRVGWAASGRNGGFCEASLTHGHENGLRRWPDEMDQLDRLGHENLDAIGTSAADYGMDVEFERTGTLTVLSNRTSWSGFARRATSWMPPPPAHW